MRIIFFSSANFEKQIYSQQNRAFNHQLEFVEEELNDNSIDKCQGFDAVSVFVNNKLDLSIIKRLSKLQLKYILLRSTGYDHIDLEAAKRFGIEVFNVQNYSPSSVAEHALTLTLMLLKNARQTIDRHKEFNYELEGLLGARLSEKTIGIIGFGQIGAAFSKLLLGFDCRVLTYDPYQERGQLGVENVSLETLLKNSDIISLHCPLTPETNYLIDERAIKQMKPQSILINTGRGGLINTKDLLVALKQNKIAAAGLDVYEHETDLFFKNHENNQPDDTLFLELLKQENVIVTPHTAFFTDEAVKNIANILLQNATDIQERGTCDNQV